MQNAAPGAWSVAGPPNSVSDEVMGWEQYEFSNIPGCQVLGMKESSLCTKTQTATRDATVYKMLNRCVVCGCATE